MGIRLPKFGWFAARPKTAWCCRWVLGSVAVLALAAWVFTRWWEAELSLPTFASAELADGRLFVQEYSEMGVGFPSEAHTPHWSSLSETAIVVRLRREPLPEPGEFSSGFMVAWQMPEYINVPLWYVFVPTTLIAFAAWRNRWLVKRDVGTCRTCGYDRTGLKDASTACPECGTAPGAGRRA